MWLNYLKSLTDIISYAFIFTLSDDRKHCMKYEINNKTRLFAELMLSSIIVIIISPVFSSQLQIWYWRRMFFIMQKDITQEMFGYN